ncbi:uncharacterized protein DNG_04439 [Cephalotrichum gorgonifer]|uniref:Rhodopsin domain-containing protein n=1 Tax=Cephalotrichum gorgonifer TaxID=2041049 RepID=A0AAE8MW50_9PEZI|nr:uncharacterized protein DNG_04439 [Cephalotrichum gorgonifer]
MDTPPVNVPITHISAHYARLHAIVITLLLALSILLVGARVYSRYSALHRLNLDDWIISAGFMFAFGNWTSLIYASRQRLEYDDIIPASVLRTLAPLSVVSALLSTWAVALIKTSIAVMLLRFQKTKVWEISLYILIALQVIVAVFLTILQTTRCVPINANWDPTVPNARCLGDNAFRISLTVGSVIVIATDVILSLMPIAFLRNMRHPLRDRIVIGGLMSLGVVASAASVVKTVVIQKYSRDPRDDPIGTGIAISLWASIEEQLGIIAACVPCLKAFSHRLLARMGLASSYKARRSFGSYNRYGGDSLTHNRVASRLRGETTTTIHASRNHKWTEVDEEVLVHRPDHDGILRETEVEIEMSRPERSVAPEARIGLSNLRKGS